MEDPTLKDFFALGKTIGKLRASDRSMSAEEIEQCRKSLKEWNVYLGDVICGLEIIMLEKQGISIPLMRLKAYDN